MNEHFIFSGHDTVELAENFGTPLYVISENKIAEAVNRIKAAFEKFGLDYDINYAGKAFTNMAMVKIVKSLGISLDTVSGGEIYTALKAGMDPKRICFHGNNKSVEELTEAVEAGIGVVTIDSFYEIGLLGKIAKKLGKVQDVHFRITPGVEAHTHEYIQTGRVDSKFGIPLNMAVRAARMIIDEEYLNLTGVHCHIGSDISSSKPFEIAANTMLEVVYNIKEMGVEIKDLNLGGGFGINYLHDDPVFDVEEYVGRIDRVIRKQCDVLGLKIPRIIVEPGRYIIGPAGITLYTVGTIKEIPYLRKYISVDGGMTDNPRPALYGAVYHAFIANKYDKEPNELYTISGRCCETDTLIKDILLPSAAPGDIIAVTNTGAYNYAMASNYNRLRKPAIVLLKDDKAELMVKQESYDHIIANDVIPSWLED